MTATITESILSERARDVLKRAGNPFRNYFARNPDDEVCARYHVAELFAPERDLLHAIIDLYRYDPMTHSEIVPVLGNKGAGKTHLLHSIKHGAGGHWQLLVTPGIYQKETDFLEYLLFQIIDTLLGGGKQKGIRPLEYIGEQLVRRQLGIALREMSANEKIDLFPPPGLGRWARRLGVGSSQANERADWLAENLSGYSNFARIPAPLHQALAEAKLSPERAFELVCSHVARTEAHNTAGLMRRHILNGFAKAALLKEEADIAGFLTFGFAELEFHVRPSRQDLVLALFKVLTDIFRGLKLPVVVAFDQLEDLLLARRSDDAHKTAESFFAGIVQVMHQIDGLCFLVFAERGLWNRFVPSLDGYIQDRLNNPVHVPKHGTVKAIRLEAPRPELVRRVVEARLRPCLDELPEGEAPTDLTPFTYDQVMRVAGTEPTLRDMLQQFRHLFDHVIYGPDDIRTDSRPSSVNRLIESLPTSTMDEDIGEPGSPDNFPMPASLVRGTVSRISELLGHDDDSDDVPEHSVRTVTVVRTPPALPPAAEEIPLEVRIEDLPEAKLAYPITRLDAAHAQRKPMMFEVPPEPTTPVVAANASRKLPMLTHGGLVELWEQEQRAARRKLEPEGSLTGATRELQAGLGAFLGICHEHGVKVGPWRLQHVVPEFGYGDHPTYGVVSIAHWACKDGQPWKLGVGLFLARGAGKPKDLEVKLGVMASQPPIVDHLILLRPEDDLTLSGKSKSLWLEAERHGKHARLEPATLDGFAQLYSFPRWLAVVRESLPEGVPLPNLADVIQEQCEKLLEQVCMPIQG